jgi:hypothetical protein
VSNFDQLTFETIRNENTQNVVFWEPTLILLVKSKDGSTAIANSESSLVHCQWVHGATGVDYCGCALLMPVNIRLL